jgi:hypothetical protein
VAPDEGSQQRHLLKLDRLDFQEKFLIRAIFVVQRVKVLRYEMPAPQVDDTVCSLVGVDRDFDLDHAW